MSKRPNPVALMQLLRRISEAQRNDEPHSRIADVGTSLTRFGVTCVVPEQDGERAKTVH